MRKPKHEEVHLCTPGRGHILETDCWCEPTRVYFLNQENGEPLKVIEHNDDATAARPEMLQYRVKHPDWVDVTLARILLSEGN